MFRNKLTLSSFVFLLMAGNAYAQVTVDATSTGACNEVSPACNATTTLTFTHTTASQSNRQAFVGVLVSCASGGTAPTVTSITYNGDALEEARAAVTADSNRRAMYLWRFPAGSEPDVGTGLNVVVTLSGDIGSCGGTYALRAGIVTVYNVDGTTPIQTTNTNSGTGTSATLTMSGSSAGNLGIGFVCAGGGLTSTTETELFQVDDTASSCHSFGIASAAAGDTSWSWSIPSDSWLMIGGVWNVVGGGGTPTTLYFPASTAAAITPTQDAAWDDTGQFVRRKLADTKGSSSIAAGTTINITEDTGNQALDRQYISTRMNADAVFTSGVTTITSVLMMREFANTNDVNQCILGVRILSEDGSTVRATLFTVSNHGTTGEFINNATHRNKICANAATIGASYTTVLGDRIVVEVGYQTDGLETMPQAATKWGENASDCAVNDTGTTDCAGFITFSNTITFAGEVSGACSNRLPLLGVGAGC